MDQDAVSSSPSSFSSSFKHALEPVPPPSLLVLTGGVATKKQRRVKKKRRRHSRKAQGPEYEASRGPFGGPKEWLGRRDWTEGGAGKAEDVVIVPPHVLAALDAKAAKKAEKKRRRLALSGGGQARICSELGQEGAEEEESEVGDAPPPRPKIKYLPSLYGVKKKPQGHSFGLQSTYISYVDNLE